MNAETLTETGGTRIGLFNISYPFATLQANPEEIRLDIKVFGFGQTFSFPKEKVIHLKKHNGLFHTGIQIEHRVPNSPKTIIFWPQNLDKIGQGLEEKGWKIEDPTLNGVGKPYKTPYDNPRTH